MTDKINYTSAQVAGQLGTDAKVLRRFLRATPEWSNPGSGGRYSFTASDVRTIKRQFPRWLADATKPTTARPKRSTVRPTATGAKVVPATVQLPPVDTTESPEVWDGPLPTPVEVAISGAARAARLDARLRATGMHLSQMSTERLANKH